MKKQEKKFKVAAIITIRKPSKMTAKGKKEIADWIVEKGKQFDKETEDLSSPFSYRYYYVASKL